MSENYEPRWPLNHSAKKIVQLLKSYGVSDDEIEKLLDAADRVATYRNASVIGYRHLIIAAGIDWGSRKPDSRRAEG